MTQLIQFMLASRLFVFPDLLSRKHSRSTWFKHSLPHRVSHRGGSRKGAVFALMCSAVAVATVAVVVGVWWLECGGGWSLVVVVVVVEPSEASAESETASTLP